MAHDGNDQPVSVTQPRILASEQPAEIVLVERPRVISDAPADVDTILDNTREDDAAALAPVFAIPNSGISYAPMQTEGERQASLAARFGVQGNTQLDRSIYGGLQSDNPAVRLLAQGVQDAREDALENEDGLVRQRAELARDNWSQAYVGQGVNVEGFDDGPSTRFQGYNLNVGGGQVTAGATIGGSVTEPQGTLGFRFSVPTR